MPSHSDVLLLGHGTVENLDDLPAFLGNIRRGRASPPELVAEIRRRHAAIGGSPLLRISRELAGHLERRIGARVHLATRFWHPFAKDVLGKLASEGCADLRVVPLAPYSGHVYAGEIQAIANELRALGGHPPRLACAPSWGTEPLLIEAFARALSAALQCLPPDRRAPAHVFFTAHSLPVAVVRNGDPYPDEVRAAADAVVARAQIVNPHRVVYQSQGATPDPWLGPGVAESLLEIADGGAKDVVFCPIGFLSDHIEVLYDLDIEASAQAKKAGIFYIRTVSLNASTDLVGAMAAVVSRL